jgi:phage recombination protein Bet
MTTAIATAPQKEKAMEFTPFGAADKIKLTVEIIKNIVATPTKTGKTCNDRDAIKFMMLCQAQRLNPFAGDAYLTGYDGKDGPKFSLITAHVAFLKRAESSPDFEGMESGVILQSEEGGAITEREGDFTVKGETVVGGWAKVYRKGRKPTYRRLSIEQRRPNYDTPFWQGVKASEQIVKCAEADALRATFPTLLGGLHGEGEIVQIEAMVSPADMPTRALVGAYGGLPEQERPRIDDTAKPSPQQELEGIVLAGGFTFPQLVKFGVESGNITDADSLTQFSEVKTDEAKRLIRAKTGLLTALAKIKEGEEML